MSVPDDYPVQLSVDYPDSSDRLKTLFRIILAIPIVIVLVAVGGYTTSGEPQIDQYAGGVMAGGALIAGPLLMILFRQKYPRWWFNWNVELLRFSTRVSAYLLLMRDEYPSTDEEQAIHIEIQYPDAENELNRFLPLVKWILAAPHLIILAVLATFAFLVVVIVWFAILITGNYPRLAFTFIEGLLRWGTRVTAYAFLLTTDRYPPFRFSP
ncbi:MAG: DUF4389 domain-containing protein [Chloroflexi bacterium]|nr:DUF4389 domain-containing protein [Chloroflexota bacterium]